MVHDNTFAFSSVINTLIVSGGKTLTLSGGTYLTNKLIIPTGFTLQGSGKNTIIKRQYFGSDLNDGGGNSLTSDGNFVGIGFCGLNVIVVSLICLIR